MGNRDERSLVLGGWLVDGTGKPLQRDVCLETFEGRIAAIRPLAPEDLKRPGAVDGRSYTLIPPLIDAHVHLAMSGTSDITMRSRQLDAPFEEMAPLIHTHLQHHGQHGVMAVRDGGDHRGHTLRFKRIWERESAFPVIAAAGRAWHAPGRYGRLIGRPPYPQKGLAQSILEDQESGNPVKIVQSGLNSLTRLGVQTAPQFDVAALKRAVDTAKGLGRQVMVHANGILPVQWAVEAGCHSIEHGFFMGRDNLSRMADKGVVWVPTAVTMAAYAREKPPGSTEARIALQTLEHQREQIHQAMELGVPLALGTDSGSPGVHHGAAVSEEMHILLESGLTLEQVVHCATGSSARLLGLEKTMGSLTTGMPALFLLVEGPPARLLRNLGNPECIRFHG